MELSVILWLVGELVKLAPEIRMEISALLSKNEPTDADWDKLESVASKPYQDQDPSKALPG